jgi:hypothetical protein
MTLVIVGLVGVAVFGTGLYALWRLYGPEPYSGTWMNEDIGMALVIERRHDSLFGEGKYVVWPVTPDSTLISQSAWSSADHLYYRLSSSDPSFEFAETAGVKLVGEKHIELSQFGTDDRGLPATRTTTFAYWNSRTGEASLNATWNDVHSVLNFGE